MSPLEDFCGSPFWDTNKTWNTTDPDFTECFEKTVLVWIPCLFLWIAAPLELLLIKKFRRRILGKTFLNQCKWVLCIIIIGTQITNFFTTLYSYHEGIKIPPVDFYTPIIYLFTFLLCFAFLILDYKKGRHTSGVLFLFWLILMLCNVVEFRTLLKTIEHTPDSATKLPFIIYIIYFCACLGQLFLSAFADVSSSVKAFQTQEKRSPEEIASFLSKLTFTWFDRFAWVGFRRPITPEDLWTLKNEFKTLTVGQKYDRSWEKEVQKELRSQTKKTTRRLLISTSYDSLPEVETQKEYKKSVTKALCRTFGVPFCVCTILKIIGDLAGLASPLLLQELIGFVSTKAPMWQGIMYVVLLSAAALMESMFQNQHWDIIMKISLQVKSALISSIYKKSLKISNSSKITSTTGEIVNLMSVDAQRMSEMTIDLPVIFASPIQIGIAIYMMYNVLGVSAFIGLSIILLIAPINAILARKIEKLELLTMEYKDERIKIMNEILAGIKVLKLYAWEPSFAEKINAVRKKEIDVMKTLVWLNSTIWFLFNCAPFLISLTMFAAYVLIDENHVLDASTAFVSLSILHIIQEPLSFAPVMIAVVIQMRVSLERLGKFMNLDELDFNEIDHEKKNDVISIENGFFTWQADSEPILSEISLKVQKGSLVAIVGSVGSGKSSLISSILGEMKKLNGHVNTFGTIAYVPQIAWIQNATLRDNILFGQNLDERLYESIIDACALRPDLSILPGGDLTEIGEKGINLSGGQKQRVSLGRSVYNDADIYLLDDPLSAVDSHVGKHIFDKVIGPEGLLRKKTRILVTHGLMHLPKVDAIVVLERGKIADFGSYQELLDKKGTFYELIQMSQNEKHSQTGQSEKDIIGDNIQIGSFSSRNEGEKYLRQISSKSITSMSSEDGSIKDGISIRAKLSTQLSHQEFVSGKIDFKANLISEETVETGKVGKDVYFHYINSIGKLSCIVTALCFMVAWGLGAASSVWLSLWSSDPPGDIELRNIRLGVFGAFSSVQSIIMFVGYVLAGTVTLKAAKILHSTMLIRVLRSPMSFFDTTPLGRIINRFSHDVDTVDSTIPNIIIFLMELIFQLISTIIVICISTPVIVAVFIPVGVLYYFTQKFYISTSRQLKRLASNFRSPIYSHFSETLSGLAVIRAFKVEAAFTEESNNKVDGNHKAVYPSLSARRWLSVRLDFLGNIIIFCTAMFSVIKRDSIDSSTLGLTVSYAITMTFVFNWLAKMMSELETYIVSVERIKEYSEIDSEASWTKEIENINAKWPDEGTVVFDNYSTKYREGLELVLKGISCNIKHGQKIGIVGRTGAGKSSLTLALFRLIEATGGKILIDGVNIAELGLHTLRSRLTIIPQDPILFCGTLRMNLDPFNQYDDQKIWYALEHSHLKEFVSTLKEGLMHEITESGENLSVGQRQLLCLARALLRKSTILILDEATAAVDLETDELIQTTIRKEFADCTVFTIAHRLNTIMDSSRIVVLKNGIIQEFDSPSRLLKNPKSLFYSMAKDAGLVDKI